VDDLTSGKTYNPGHAGQPGLREVSEQCHNSTKLQTSTIQLLNIATPSADQPDQKSEPAGNQQKVILARWLAINPQVLILTNPRARH